MWILLRWPKMNGAILGFQKRVWCPKWTPASSISRMVTDIGILQRLGLKSSLNRGASIRDSTGDTLSGRIRDLLCRTSTNARHPAKPTDYSMHSPTHDACPDPPHEPDHPARRPACRPPGAQAGQLQRRRHPGQPPGAYAAACRHVPCRRRRRPAAMPTAPPAPPAAALAGLAGLGQGPVRRRRARPRRPAPGAGRMRRRPRPTAPPWPACGPPAPRSSAAPT